MSEPIPLDYSPRRRQPFSKVAIVALIVAICSGPTAVSIASVSWKILGDTGAIFLGGASGLTSLLFCTFVYIRLERSDRPPRGHHLALVGIFITLAWALALILLV